MTSTHRAHFDPPALAPDLLAFRGSPKLLKRLALTHRACAAIERWSFGKMGEGVCELTARAMLPALTGTLLCETRMGVWICLSVDSGNHIYLRGTYEAGTLDVMSRLLRPGDVFIDAGASIGLMSLTAAQYIGPSGRVLAFEPTARRFAQLKVGIAANAVEQIVSAFQCGLGSTEQEVVIHHDRPSPSMVGQGSAQASEHTKIRRLADVLREEKVASVRMLKIDVEGFELDVLQGACELLEGPHAPAISIEHGVYSRGGLCPLSFALAKNPAYQMFQLAGSKSTKSKLRRVRGVSQCRKFDNIFFFLPEHLSALQEIL